MKRPDAWHDAYRAIYSTTGCIRLDTLLDQEFKLY